MTFVDGFYSFNLELSLVTRGVYASTRIKIPKHPEESREALIARVVAFCHSYEEGLQIGPGPFNSKLPTLYSKDILDEITLGIEVGDIDPDKVRKALRKHPRPRYQLYFYDSAQIDRFCSALKGSTENWIFDLLFFKVDPNLLSEIAAHLISSSKWIFTESDANLFLSSNGFESESAIIQFDMWGEFQNYLKHREEIDPKA